MKFYKSLKYVILLIAFVFFLPVFFSEAGSNNAVSWRFDDDWSDWTKLNVELAGTNQGLRLKSDDAGLYQSSGYASYKFSPGGKIKWKNADISSSSTSANAGSSLWLGSPSSGLVSQVGLDGITDAQWGAGKAPTVMSIGCNNDVWVANTSVGTGSGLADSITHIVPELNKSVTREIGGGLGAPSTISVSCSVDGESYVWVGLRQGKKIIKINQDLFDGLTSNQTISDQALSGVSVDLPNCGDNCPYTSSLNSSGEYLYVMDKNNQLMRINTKTNLLDQSFFINVTGESVIPDGYDNIYLANPDDSNKGIYRVDSSGNIISFPTSFRPMSIVIIPASDSEKPDKVIASTFQTSGNAQVCSADLVGASGNVPAIGAFSCVSIGGSPSAGGYLDYDENTDDVWFVPKDSSKIFKVPSADNYQSFTQYEPGGPAWIFSTKGDFLGSSINYGSGNLVVEFSTDNNKWYSLEDMKNSLLPDSSDLYIRVIFNGQENWSPILKSLTISYESQESLASAIYMEKKMLLVSDDGKSSSIGSSFYPGDEAIVRIKIRANYERLEGLIIKDYRPDAVDIKDIPNSSDEKTKLCQLSSADQIIGASNFNDNLGGNYSQWNNINIDSNKDYYLCYKYKISVGQESKNILKQVRADVIGQSSGDLERLLVSSNNYLLIKGVNYIDSREDSKELDSAKDPIVAQNDDALSATNTSAISAGLSTDLYLKSSPFYLYRRGIGEKSRGGTLLSLPVRIDDLNNNQLANDSSYILYNPSYYIFGDVFTGNDYSGNKLDYGSRSLSVSREDLSIVDKQNSDISQYEYDFDENSLVYWDSSSDYKNKKMQENIDKYIKSGDKPAIMCDLSSPGYLKGSLNLSNKDCALNMADSSNMYPNGRVWYLKQSGQTIDIGKNDGSSSNVRGRGTIIIETDSLVRINSLNFGDQDSMGLIVIGGGRVEFSKYASNFRGIIFNPASSSNGGRISFETGSGAKAIRIFGSLVADEIKFSPRTRTASDDYSIMVYYNSKLLNQPLPAFEGSSEIFKK